MILKERLYMKNKTITKLLEVRNGIYQSDLKNIRLQEYETQVKVDTYSYGQQELQKLNVYVKKGYFSKPKPLLIDIHGGGWVYGDKDTNGLLCMDFAKKDYIVMSMSYRLIPEFTILQSIQDIFASLHYLYSLKDKYNIDFNNVAIMGDSAGGHLNMLINAINNSATLLDYFNVNKLPFKVKCIIANHPAINVSNISRNKDYERAFRRLAFGYGYTKSYFYPYLHAKKFSNFLDKSIPILIITSIEDDIVREKAFELKSILKKKNIPYRFYDEKDENSEHVFNVTRPFRNISIKCNNYIDSFIKENLK